jgi:thiamine pyrophosphokinase
VQGRAPQTQIAEFDDLLVIVGGGAVDLDLLRELYAIGGRLVGADGGADQIVEAGLKPEVIIGDFDSLSDPLGWLGKTRLIQIPEQETTDFEKSLYSTRAPVTVALGMTGGRFDHTLAAIDALARYAKRRRVILVDEYDIALGLTDAIIFEVDRGDRVSVHPLAPVTFWRSAGLEYPLDAVKLAPGVRTGTSNRAIEGKFEIYPEEGIHAPYLLILDRKYLMRLIAEILIA